MPHRHQAPHSHPALQKRALKRSSYSQTADGYRLRASGICFRDADRQEMLMINSRRKGLHWILPGGGIEPGEAAMDAALRECYEEAGVCARVDCFVGEFKNEENRTITFVYSLIVEELSDSYEDAETGRLRQWFTLEAAKENLTQFRPHQLGYLMAALQHQVPMSSSAALATVATT